MLVLTRKPGERILIGEDIVVTVLDSRGDGIRVGIDAPRGISIQRAEVVKAVAEANVEAARADEDAEAKLRARLGLIRPAAE
ncbi:MAG: carbon storage regulator [Microbacteriaceae bacterium]|nr:MAG: carbon storage regulator [Microbacteriaceae bacterium]